MCTWHYLHHHHLPPCPRPIDMVVHYSYCPDAIATSDGGLLPCNNPAQWDETTQAAMMVGLAGDYDDPCATGGCLVSPDCSSGGCRVGELGGRWSCCQCGGHGNEYRWCQHRMRTSPDTFCYHVCCTECRADAGSSSSGMSSSSSSSSKRRRQK